MITPMETSTKAASVPMFTSSPRVTRGSQKARIPEMTPVMIVIRYGVRKRVWTRENHGGSRLSRLMAKGYPALAEDQDHHHHREPDEDGERDDELRGREGRRSEGRRRRGRGAQLGVRHEPGKDNGRQEVENRAYSQGSQDAYGHVPLGVAGLLRHGRHDVEAYEGEEDQRCPGEDAGDTVDRVYSEKGWEEKAVDGATVGLSRRLRRGDEGRKVINLDKPYPEADDEQRHEDLDARDHLVEHRAQFYPYDQNGRHERYYDQRQPVVGEALRRGIEPRRQLYSEDLEHAHQVSRPALGDRSGT